MPVLMVILIIMIFPLDLDQFHRSYEPHRILVLPQKLGQGFCEFLALPETPFLERME